MATSAPLIVALAGTLSLGEEMDPARAAAAVLIRAGVMLMRV